VRQIVRGKGDRDPVAEQNPNAELTHPPAELRTDGAARVELDFELSAGIDLADDPFDLYVVAPVISRSIEVASFPPATTASSRQNSSS